MHKRHLREKTKFVYRILTRPTVVGKEVTNLKRDSKDSKREVF